MHGRAYLLLQRDFYDLKENNYKGITARPVSEDMMEWEVEIEGLQNSVWQGLVFQLTIHFTSEYNYAPPVVKFVTIPFHPNVDPHTGQPCIDFLDNPEKWNTNYTLSSILLALQVMLSNPVLENPVNLEAARILTKDESLYRTILKLFNRPLQMKDDSQELPKDPHKCIGPTKTTSFSDYYQAWSRIATSKATEYYRTALLKDPNFIGQYYKWKKMDLQHHKEWNLKYSVIKCWLAKKNRMPDEVRHSMEGIKLCPTQIPTTDEIFLESPTAINSVTNIYETEEEGWKSDTSLYENDTDEPWEEEVEDLISWINTLNTNTLED
ncbi:ubiquitin-conjugating enzyme E2 U isoform X1 [Macaca thibetana thibetana]|uniref:ubiquitin-conjugating enzyme E2 U isoform X1 n=1 Tax=Macaca thibetana thibetana TaxID=257877 RepID=UPI0021BCB4DF|nr:ubiquitin-conjugating enzyme E2 U isoform X1 [Macaca thibetana thibetana]